MKPKLSHFKNEKKFFFNHVETIEMMEMDSPFHHQNGANIEGTNLNVLKQGQMITLTCRVTENEGEHSKRIDWMKDGVHVSLQVSYIFLFILFSIFIKATHTQ